MEVYDKSGSKTKKHLRGSTQDTLQPLRTNYKLHATRSVSDLMP